jgi:hypothetical protein
MCIAKARLLRAADTTIATVTPPAPPPKQRAELGPAARPPRALGGPAGAARLRTRTGGSAGHGKCRKIGAQTEPPPRRDPLAGAFTTRAAREVEGSPMQYGYLASAYAH